MESLEPSDADLLRSSSRGDERAFHSLVDRHANALFQLEADDAYASARGR